MRLSASCKGWPVSFSNIPVVIAGLSCLLLATISIASAQGIQVFSACVLVAILSIPDMATHFQHPQRWLLIPIIVIAASAFIHAVTSNNVYDWAGIGTVIIGILLLLLGRYVGVKLLWVFTLFGLLESILLIITQAVDPHPSNGVIFAIAHFSCFIILIGVFSAPQKYRWALLVLAIPAILMSGSEEGIWLLGIVAFVMFLRRDFSKYTWVLVFTTVVTLAIIIPTGQFSAAHPNLNNDRITTIDNASNDRVSPYKQAIGMNIIWGTGWDYDTRGQTIHNVPLKVAYQWGILAGLSIVVIVVFGFMRTRYKYIWALMAGSMLVDHYLWTHLLPWFWLLAGVASLEGTDHIFIKHRSLSLAQDTISECPRIPI